MVRVIDTETKRITESFFKVEEELGLFDLQVCGVYIWPLMRMVVYRKLLLRFQGEFHANMKKRRSRLSIYRYFKDFVCFDGCLRGKTIIIPHQRSSYNRDLYTRREIEEDNSLVLTLYNNDYPNAVNLKNIVRLQSLLSLVSRIKYLRLLHGKLDVEVLQKIEEMLRRFAIEMDVEKYVLRRVAQFIFRRKIFIKILLKFRPEKLIMPCLSYAAPLVAACKELSIPCYEIQHGAMARWHLQYSYPLQTKPVFYQPDYLCLWGQFWADNVELAPNVKPILLGRDAKYLPKLRRVEGDNIKVVFASQDNCVVQLYELAVELAENCSQYVICYKLHPSQNKKDFLESGLPSNIYISDKPMEEELSDTNFQVGINSTTLVEGLTQGIVPIFLNIDGVEYYEFLINKFDLPLVKNVEEMKQVIADCDVQGREWDSNYFWGG